MYFSGVSSGGQKLKSYNSIQGIECYIKIALLMTIWQWLTLLETEIDFSLESVQSQIWTGKTLPDQRGSNSESKSDLYSKDLMFFASFAFFVITFEPIMIQTCSSPQNDRLNFSFVNLDGKKLARNGQKTATYYAASFLPHYRRVQFSHLLVFSLWLYV